MEKAVAHLKCGTKSHHFCSLAQYNSIKIVNNASFTTNCLSLLRKVIMTTLALLKKTVESPDDCVTAQSIITESTGTANASGKVIQELNGNLIATMHPYQQTAKYDYIKKVVTQASESPLRGILDYTKGQVVSRNFNSDSYSSVFDAGAGIALNDHVVKLIS
ncbi:hypothetical protein A6R68_05860, partial [Neotoma lepida]